MVKAGHEEGLEYGAGKGRNNGGWQPPSTRPVPHAAQHARRGAKCSSTQHSAAQRSSRGVTCDGHSASRRPKTHFTGWISHGTLKP